MISLRDVVTGFVSRDPLAEVWRRSLRGGSAVITGVPPLRYIGNGRPLTDYLISGNTVQDGTPTPDAPVDATGCGVRTANLYDINAKDTNNGYVNDAQLTEGGTTATWGSAEISEYIPINGDTAYTFNGIGSYNSPCYGLYDENKQLIGAYRYNGAAIIRFTSPRNAKWFRFTHIKTSTHAMMVKWSYTQSTMPEYEPYGFKLPLAVNGVEYPIYLGQVETTRRIKKLVFDGTEPWNRTTSGNNTRTYTPQIPECMSLSPAICTHFNYNVINVGYPRIGDFVINSAKAIIFGVDGNTFVDVDTWKSYLAAQYAAGTPVTVWYVLAEPETAVVNEPLMKIGDYADTISAAQAGVTIPTVSGENVLDVPAEVKPSQITIEGGISSV